MASRFPATHATAVPSGGCVSHTARSQTPAFHIGLFFLPNRIIFFFNWICNAVVVVTLIIHVGILIVRLGSSPRSA